MVVDYSIMRDFVAGDITAKAVKSYLKERMVHEGCEVPNERNKTFTEMIKIILSAAQADTFIIDGWEKTFLYDNLDTTNPSTNQTDRVAKIWRRYNQIHGDSKVEI